jgi:hypothetical protein
MSVVELMQSLGLLGVVAFAVSLSRLLYVFATSSGKTIMIGWIEAFSLITVFTTVASTILILWRIKDMSQYHPLHLNISLAFAGLTTCTLLFWFRSRYPSLEVLWKQITKKPPGQTICFVALFEICIQLVAYFTLPLYYNVQANLSQPARFYSIFVGDIRHSIGLGNLICWCVVVMLVVMFASLDLKKPKVGHKSSSL